jgi:hypothetical protein
MDKDPLSALGALFCCILLPRLEVLIELTLSSFPFLLIALSLTREPSQAMSRRERVDEKCSVL